MLEAFHNGKFDYKKLSPEEQKQRGILGRLTGIIADTSEPTRNGRLYSKKLWQNVFKDPIMQEKIANRCVFMELGHPADRTEIDMEKVCACLAEQPKIGDDGKIYGTIDILDTKNGRLLKTLCDYGTTVGISSRGEGDLITNYDGHEEVDPDTYTCETWDIVLVPSVKSARLQYVTESLDKTRYNKTLRESLQKTIDKANDEEKAIMRESLKNLGIRLQESVDTFETVEELADYLELDDTEKEAFINDVNNSKGCDWLEVVEAKCPECLLDFKKFICYNDSEKSTRDESDMVEKNLDTTKDITDESLNINEEKHIAVDNNEAIVEELQKTITAKAELEQKLMELQEKLSVCYAKEAQNEEDVVKYKTTIKKLAEDAKQLSAVQARASKLEESLREAKETNVDLNDKLKDSIAKIKFAANKSVSLKESVSSKDTKINALNESVSKLTSQVKTLSEEKVAKDGEIKSLKEAYSKKIKSITEASEKEKSELNEKLEQLQKDINLQKSGYAQKLEKSNALIEKYKKATSTAVDKYISLQASRLGSSVKEIKNRLPESYSFKDIDEVCEGLQEYKLNMSKLPFNTMASTPLKEGLKVKGTSSKNESILPASAPLDDEIDEDLMYLAGR